MQLKKLVPVLSLALLGAQVADTSRLSHNTETHLDNIEVVAQNSALAGILIKVRDRLVELDFPENLFVIDASEIANGRLSIIPKACYGPPGGCFDEAHATAQLINIRLAFQQTRLTGKVGFDGLGNGWSEGNQIDGPASAVSGDPDSIVTTIANRVLYLNSQYQEISGRGQLSNDKIGEPEVPQ